MSSQAEGSGAERNGVISDEEYNEAVKTGVEQFWKKASNCHVGSENRDTEVVDGAEVVSEEVEATRDDLEAVTDNIIVFPGKRP